MKEMPNQLRINVIGRDLEIAQKGDHHGCAIACAIIRGYPNLNRISVKGDKIAVSDPVARQRYLWNTPEVAKKWIQQFDSGNDVGPLKIILHKKDAVTKPIRNRTAEERAYARTQAENRKNQLATETKREGAQRLQRDSQRKRIARGSGL